MAENASLNGFEAPVEKITVDPSAAAPESNPNDPLDGLPDDFIANITKHDPELAEARKPAKKATPSRKAAKEEAPPADDDGEEPTTDDEPPSDGDEQPADDDDAEAPVNDDGEPENVQFDESVIPGLTAEHIKGMPKEALAALADHVISSREGSEAFNETKNQLESLMSDPVIAARKTMLDAGKVQYSLRPIVFDELKAVADELGLDREEAEKLVPVIQKIVQDRALDVSNQQLLEQDKIRQVKEATTKGQSLFSNDINSLLPKDMQIKEKNFAKLLNEGAKHPEWKKAEKGLLKIQQYCIEKKLTYSDLTDPNAVRYMSPKELYAAAAAKYDLPVALNTSERDRKMLGDAVRKKLSVFYKNKGDTARNLAVDTGDSGRPQAQAVIDRGYDIIKLATDPKYYDTAIRKKAGDHDHLKFISELREKGEAALNKRNRRAA